MPIVTATLDPAISVNELLRRCPSVLPVLNAFGVDSCCGGAESLTLAARSAEVPLEGLMAELSAAVQRAASVTTHAGTSQGATTCVLPSTTRSAGR
jgi:iron-sulfur cluster repair protein YtfE (RIC family)